MHTLTKLLCSFLSLPSIFSLALPAQQNDAVQKSADQDKASHANLSQNFKFERLTIAHGLPHNRVMCILQDSRGFMWFGTKDGLARYDGYSFKVYKHDPADSTTISNNIIWAILEDQSSTLWVGTSNGLNEFVRASETFKRYLPDPHDLNGLNARIIRTIVESRRQPMRVNRRNGVFVGNFCARVFHNDNDRAFVGE